MQNKKTPHKNDTISQEEVVHMKPSAIATAKRRRKKEEGNFSDELAHDESISESGIQDEDRNEITGRSFLENDDFYSLRSTVHRKEV